MRVTVFPITEPDAPIRIGLATFTKRRMAAYDAGYRDVPPIVKFKYTFEWFERTAGERQRRGEESKYDAD